MAGEASGLSAAERETLVAQQRAVGNTRLFGPAEIHDDVVDGDGKALTDGMRLSFNGDGHDEVLVPGWDEVKKQFVVADAFPQFDEDLRRMLERGIRLKDGRYFPPDKIRFLVLRPRPPRPLSQSRLGRIKNDRARVASAARFRSRSGRPAAQ